MAYLLSRRNLLGHLSRAITRKFSVFESNVPIVISPEVEHALKTGAPVVALESTIITHGMPYPVNLETAIAVEKQVRQAGATPATICLLNGQITVGLKEKQLEILSDSPTTEKIKISRRDLAAAVGLGKSGGTTISATSLIAALAGIRIFSTGGLGGVHRGGEKSWDVSADLTELGRTPIAVVSAGVKSILDIGRTLEYLETQGVAVFTYGSNYDFPGFYSARSGFKSPWKVDSFKEAAQIIDASHRLGLQSGLLFAAPIPEEFESSAGQIQAAVDQAVKESEENGVSSRGKEATPWILNRVAELTAGKSIINNIALIKNTAFIGGKIAVEYAKLAVARKDDDHRDVKAGNLKPNTSVSPSSVTELPPADLLVIGAAAVDVISQPLGAHITFPSHTTHPGKVGFSMGGVARNMAEAAHRVSLHLGDQTNSKVVLVSPIANDLSGNFIMATTQQMGMRIDGFIRGEGSSRSAVCNMHLDNKGDLVMGIADMAVVEDLSSDSVLSIMGQHKPKLVAFDANLNLKTISEIVQYCLQRGISTFFEPTSVPKSLAVIPLLEEALTLEHKLSSFITYISPNRLELTKLFQEIRASPKEITGSQHWWSVMDDLNLGERYRSDLALLSKVPTSNGMINPFTDGIPQMAVTLLPFFQHMFIKCGENGVFVAMRVTNEADLDAWSKERTSAEKRQLVFSGKKSILLLKHYPVSRLQDPVINVTGAGDSLAGTLLAHLIQQGTLTPQRLNEMVREAHRAAALSLCSSEAVSPLL